MKQDSKLILLGRKASERVLKTVYYIHDVWCRQMSTLAIMHAAVHG